MIYLNWALVLINAVLIFLGIRELARRGVVGDLEPRRDHRRRPDTSPRRDHRPAPAELRTHGGPGHHLVDLHRRHRLDTRAHRRRRSRAAAAHHLHGRAEPQHHRDPEERRRRQRDEDDAARATLGETPRQRAQRHRREDNQRRRKAQRAASRLWKVGADERARRFRRWCVLTALSASAGYAVGLVQWVSTLPPLVAMLIALPAAYWLDLRMRGGWRGGVRLTDLRGASPISAVLLTRVPVSSVLASLLHLDGLLAATGHLFHHH